MQTITIQGDRHDLNRVIEFININGLNLDINSHDDELIKEYEKRADEIENKTAKLIKFDDFKKEMNEFIKAHK